MELLFCLIIYSITSYAINFYPLSNANLGLSLNLNTLIIQAEIPGRVHQNVNALQLPESIDFKVKSATNNPNN